MRERLRHTLAALEQEGVLAPAQRAIVESRLAAAFASTDRMHEPGAQREPGTRDVPDARGEPSARREPGARPEVDRMGRVVSIVAALGGVLVGLGFLYLVGYNWEDLGKPAKLVVVFAVWLGFHAAGYWLAEPAPGAPDTAHGSGRFHRGRAPRLGLALTASGVLAFGAAIALVAQVYHLTSKYPNAVLLWWLLNVPLVVWSRSRTIQLVVTALFVLWAFWHTGVWSDSIDLDSSPEDVVTFASLTLGIAGLFGALALLVRTTAHARFAGPWRALALLGAFAGVYVLSFRDGFETSDAYFSGDSTPAFDARAFLPFAVVLAPALLAVAAFAQRSEDRRPALGPLAILMVAVVIGLAAIALPGAVPLLANGLLLAGVVVLVARGVRLGRPGEINFALVVFVVVVMTRYVEYLYDRLDAGLAFLGAGILLLVLGSLLERRRRTWVAQSLGRTA
jgi:uncharacterized membrane protein